MNLESRLKQLEESTPKGYRTFGVDGEPVIESGLPGSRWYCWALDLLGSPGREPEKRILREQLSRSVGKGGDGGVLYQVVAALAAGPVVQDSTGTPAL